MSLETPIESKGGGCLCCGGTKNILSLDTQLYNGMGGYSVKKNGELYYQASIDDEFDGCKSLQDIENEAIKEPDADWRVIVYLPLRGGSYQRQAPGHWVLYEQNEGFA